MEKIGPIDWIQALKNSKLYAKDFKAYSKEYEKSVPPKMDAIRILPVFHQAKKKQLSFSLSKETKKLCRKYNLRFPIDPHVPYHESELLYLKSPIDYFLPFEFIRKIKEAPSDKKSNKKLIKKELISYLDDRLTIMINLTFSKDQIQSEFQKILDDWLERSNQRVKGNKVDIWEVYRMHQNDKISLNRIAVEKLNSSGKPAYKYEDDNKLKIIKRAYEKSCRIIAKVERFAQDKK